MTLIELLQAECDVNQVQIDKINPNKNDWIMFMVAVKVDKDKKIIENQICARYNGIVKTN
jgi:hypothetical protein